MQAAALFIDSIERERFESRCAGASLTTLLEWEFGVVAVTVPNSIEPDLQQNSALLCTAGKGVSLSISAIRIVFYDTYSDMRVVG
jgi:hypothetical protein